MQAVPAAPAGRPAPQVNRNAVLAVVAVVAVAQFMVLLDATIVNVALTHGFKGGFIVAAILCAASAALAPVLLPRRKRAVENEQAEAIAASFARCPGAPYCGHLARLVTLGRKVRRATAHR